MSYKLYANLNLNTDVSGLANQKSKSAGEVLTAQLINGFIAAKKLFNTGLIILEFKI